MTDTTRAVAVHTFFFLRSRFVQFVLESLTIACDNLGGLSPRLSVNVLCKCLGISCCTILYAFLGLVQSTFKLCNAALEC